MLEMGSRNNVSLKQRKGSSNIISLMWGGCLCSLVSWSMIWHSLFFFHFHLLHHYTDSACELSETKHYHDYNDLFSNVFIFFINLEMKPCTRLNMWKSRCIYDQHVFRRVQCSDQSACSEVSTMMLFWPFLPQAEQHQPERCSHQLLFCFKMERLVMFAFS